MLSVQQSRLRFNNELNRSDSNLQVSCSLFFPSAAVQFTIALIDAGVSPSLDLEIVMIDCENELERFTLSDMESGTR